MVFGSRRVGILFISFHSNGLPPLPLFLLPVTAVNLVCAANVAAIMCHSVFKECVEMEGRMIPALPCRSECESRKTVWDQCVADIHKDAAAKKDFDTQMLAVADTLALGVLAVWQTAFPTGSNGERSPFDFLECDTIETLMDQVVPESIRLSPEARFQQTERCSKALTLKL